MAKRTVGKPKLTPEVRQRLAEIAREAQGLLYGEGKCPEWGTSFAEIEDDAKEVGYELIRLLMQHSVADQVENMPEGALASDAGEVAQEAGTEERTIETESGPVVWNEPQAYLPKSRKAFFPSVEGFGTGR
jgi:hypothetical protein